MWEFVPGWPVPHLVWDYAAAILDFVKFFKIFVKHVRKCIFVYVPSMFDRCSIDVQWIGDGFGVDPGWIWGGSCVDLGFESLSKIYRKSVVLRSGDMWEFAPGWPVPHLVWDYAATILDFVQCFAVFVKNAGFGGSDFRKCS